MPQHIRNLTVYHTGLAHIALKGALAQILLQGFVDGRFISLYGCPKAPQSVYPEGDVQSVSFLEKITLIAQDGSDLFFIHDSSPPFR